MKSVFTIHGEGEHTLDLPETLADYRRLFDELDNLADKGMKGDVAAAEEWKAMMRLWSAGDLMFLGTYVCSTGDVWDPYQNRPFFFCEEQLDCARYAQFDSKGKVLIASRGIGKSTWVTFLKNLQTKLQDPNRAAFIYSHTREYGLKHNGRLGQEILTNEKLKVCWPDRFYWEQADYPNFSVKSITIKRTSTRPEGTWEAHAFVDKLPVGMHPDESFYDDIEEASAVSSVDALNKIETQFVDSQDITSLHRWKTVTGTYYSPVGLMRRLHTEKGWPVRIIAGENLNDKPEDPAEAGPLGGRPYFFTREALFDMIREKGGVTDPKARLKHAQQICCDPLAGEPNTLNTDLLLYYDEDPIEIASEGALYICVDCSKGGADPTFAWVWCLRPDRRFYWVGGFRKRLAPGKRKMELYLLALQFAAIGDLIQMRIEEYGAAEYVSAQQEFNEQRRCNIDIISVGGDSTQSKIDRNFDRWEPKLRERRIVFPRHLPSEDESGNPIDLVEYMVTMELGQWPKPKADDGMDAGAEIWEPEEKVGPLAWPVMIAPRRRRRLEAETSDHMAMGVY